MKPLGIVRRLDPLGRICIPREFLRINGWEERAPIEMFATKDGLVLRKYQGRDDKKTEIVETISWAADALRNEDAPKEEIAKKLQKLIPQLLQ